MSGKPCEGMQLQHYLDTFGGRIVYYVPKDASNIEQRYHFAKEKKSVLKHKEGDRKPEVLHTLKHPLTKNADTYIDNYRFRSSTVEEAAKAAWEDIASKANQTKTFEDLTTGSIVQINGGSNRATKEAVKAVTNTYGKYLEDESKNLPVSRLYINSCTFAPWISGKDFFKHCEGKEQFNEPQRIESIMRFYEDIAEFLDEPAVSSLKRQISRDEKFAAATTEILRFILERAQGKNMNELYTVKKDNMKIYYTAAEDKKINDTGRTYYFIGKPQNADIELTGDNAANPEGILMIADAKGDNPGIRTVMLSDLAYVKDRTLMHYQ